MGEQAAILDFLLSNTRITSSLLVSLYFKFLSSLEPRVAWLPVQYGTRIFV